MTDHHQPLSHSLQEYARGIAGGLLFSFPLLYTMEVWWAGYLAQPRQLILFIVITFLLLLGYNRYAGMRPGTSWRDIFIDSVEEIGIGFFLSFTILLLLGQIDLYSMSTEEMMGKVIIEAMAVSIGVSVGTAQLAVEGDPVRKEEEDAMRHERAGLAGLIVLSLCGAVLVAGNVAPTEEVLMLAMAATEWHILLMVLASLLLSVVVIFFSNFKGTKHRRRKPSHFDIIFETCICYLIALAAAAFLLWTFGRFEDVGLESVVAQTIVLGVIAALGASAGRLLIK